MPFLCFTTDQKIMRAFSKGLSALLSIGLCVGVVAVLSACDLARNQMKTDRAADLEFQDYRDSLAPRTPEPVQTSDAGVPEFLPYVAERSEALKPMPLVSISVNQTVPLRDVLFELAEQAGYDLELDPRISGAVIFKARQKPFDVVIERLTKIAGLRYEFKDEILHVELDKPYIETYKIDYLNMIRKTESSIDSSVSVVSGDGADTGSSFSSAIQTQSDFWGDLEMSIAQILEGDTDNRAMRTGTTPRVTSVSSSPRAPVQSSGGAGSDGIQVSPPEAVLRVDSLPLDEEDEDSGRASGRRGGLQGVSTFSLNRQAGLITVYATQQQHKVVEKFLKKLKRAVTSQVLIEAKVLEVGLMDEYSAGIDWDTILRVNNRNFSVDFPFAGGALDPAAAGDAVFSYPIGDSDIGATINAVSRFGTVRALASPRLTVLNNQTASLNVADNQVYFEIDIESTTDDGVTNIEVDSEINNVPEGVLINVQPSINLDDETVSLALRPTVTRVVDYVNDPAVAFVVATLDDNIDIDIESQIPVVNVQEIDSVVNLQSGQAVVMGGLMQDRVDSERTGVPVLSELPLLGSAFRNHSDKISKTELVIFIKATIIDGDNTHAADRHLYRKFSGDRRPLSF